MAEDESDLSIEGGNNNRSLIVRSEIPLFEKYGDYRPYLRNDFYHSCGYCTLSECEAQGLAFEIDHYEPVSARPELENDYNNLIYSCDECNSLKSDLTPSQAARAQGYEIFRPDAHAWEEHFSPSGTRLIHLSNVGEFTTEALDLNRQSLRRLRDVRDRLHACDALVAGGILALRHFRIDQLPPSIRMHANKAISSIPEAAQKAAETVDEILKAASHSTLLDEDLEKPSRRAKRSRYLASTKALYPGQWRGKEHKKAREIK